jgi:hypothetical protein
VNASGSDGEQPGRTAGSRYAHDGTAARSVLSAELGPDELAIVTASLRELALRLSELRARLAAVEAAVQLSSGGTSRSSRDSRSPSRSRSS